MSRKPSRSAIAKKAWKTRRMNEAMKKAPPKYQSTPMIMTDEAKIKSVTSETFTLSICNDIDNTLTTLEARLSAINARINAII